MRTRVDRHDRETFICELLKAVPTATRADALRLLRWGTTYGRLCEAQCNGDYPADNGTGGWTCPKCEGIWRNGAPVIQRQYTERNCPSCRAERIIRETCARMGTQPLDPTFLEARPLCVPRFQGDPRGYTVRLQIAGAPLDVYERPALAVPTS